jgi:hypothetical protein
MIKNLVTLIKSNFIAMSIFILLIIILFIYIILKKNRKKNNLQKFKKNVINMDNIFESIYKSEELFKELSKKCHPDKFTNKDNYQEINSLYQEITVNKKNYEKLLICKEKAKMIFNIKFDN